MAHLRSGVDPHAQPRKPGSTGLGNVASGEELLTWLSTGVAHCMHRDMRVEGHDCRVPGDPEVAKHLLLRFGEFARRRIFARSKGSRCLVVLMPG
jgi:hypothetical protein